MLSKLTFHSILAIALVQARLTEAAPHTMLDRSTAESSLSTQLRVADSAADRYALLPKDEDFVYDFSKNPALPLADGKSFPALVGTGLSFSLSQLPACGMTFVHLHPRATELFAITSGRVHSEMVPEGGVVDSKGNQRVIRTEIGPGLLTIYPAGSFHTQVNPDCEAANFTAAFNSEDTGISLVADQTFAFSDDIIARTFGQTIAGEDIDKVRDAISGDMLIKVEECLTKCGKQKRQV
ncbi:hypothetical protein F1880_006360 [Penicillium rolfsii]|nr:hypothetical protein F1880_006360 [Penicillium rolfsii]